MTSKGLTDFQKTILQGILNGERPVNLSKKYNCSETLMASQIKCICKKFRTTYWGMKGGRRVQTIKDLEKAIKIKNDSNRLNL